MTAILHRGLRNNFFFNQFTFSIFFLDFYSHLNSFQIRFKFVSNSFQIRCKFVFIQSRSHFGFLPNYLSLFCWLPFHEILKFFSTIWTFLHFWPLQSLFKNWGQLDLSVLLPKLLAKFKNLEQESSSEGFSIFLA